MEAIAFELAKTLFAGITAAAAAVQAWQRLRDAKAAAREFDRAFGASRASREAATAATELVAIIPQDVIRELEARADGCWTSYRKVLGGEYLPDEIDHATESVQSCVCRELSRIEKLTGSIPSRWRDQWRQYECITRVVRKPSPVLT